MPHPLMIDAQAFTAIKSGTYTTEPAASASANTKGSYSEAEDALARACDWFSATIYANADVDYLFDIAVGAAASEIVILSNLQFSRESSNIFAMDILIPLPLPEGVRVALRTQATTGSSTIALNLHATSFGKFNPGSLGQSATYGAATADSGSTSVDPGAMANTKGTYSELTSTTTISSRWAILGIGNQNNSDRTTAAWGIDIAVGAGGSEIVVKPDIMAVVSSATDVVTPILRSFPLTLPEGVRVATRAACSTTDATDRLIDVQLVGIG